VTGASKGIGASIARQLAAEGAAVVVNYASSRAGADRVVSEITSNGGKAIAVQADVARKADIDRLFAETKKAFGTVDVLVNNAGIYEFSPLEGVTEEHFHKQFNLNVLGLLLTTQEAVKHFSPNGGSVVNISSVVATKGVPNSAVYSGTKGGRGCHHALTRGRTGTARHSGQRHQSRHGGNGRRPHGGLCRGRLSQTDEAHTPLGRIGQPVDIAGAAVFLASNDSSWVSGETLHISGGYR